jgi:hypothetical protein
MACPFISRNIAGPSESKSTSITVAFQPIALLEIDRALVWPCASRRWMARGGYAPAPADRAHALASIDSATAQKSDLPQLEINLKVRLMSMTLQMLRTNTPDLSPSAISIKDSAFETVPLFSRHSAAKLGDMQGVPALRCPLADQYVRMLRRVDALGVIDLELCLTLSSGSRKSRLSIGHEA